MTLPLKPAYIASKMEREKSVDIENNKHVIYHVSCTPTAATSTRYLIADIQYFLITFSVVSGQNWRLASATK